MDREQVAERINAIARMITQREWYGRTYSEFWRWFGEQCRSLEAEAVTDEDRQWLSDQMLPLDIDTDVNGFMHPEAGYSSVIQPYDWEKSFEERWGIQELVAEALYEFRSESPPQFWKGKTYGEYWNWFRGKEDQMRGLARLPGEREKIDAELNDIRQTHLTWGGIVGDEPASDVIT